MWAQDQTVELCGTVIVIYTYYIEKKQTKTKQVAVTKLKLTE